MHGEVLTTTRLTPSLVRIVLGGRGLDEFAMPLDTDAYVNVALRPEAASYGPIFDPREVHDAHPKEMWPMRRRYTVRHWDEHERQLTLDFVVHEPAGPAAAWAAAAQPGDVLVFNGPGSGYRPDHDFTWHLMVGDESALPAIAASLEALDPDANAVVRLVCDGPEHEVALASPANLDLLWLHRTEVNPTSLAASVADAHFPAEDVSAFVHGEASEIRAVRRHLLLERGVPEAATSCSPYWHRGMTDEQWRAVKKQFTQAMDADSYRGLEAPASSAVVT